MGPEANSASPAQRPASAAAGEANSCYPPQGIVITPEGAVFDQPAVTIKKTKMHR
jgi:hypothetical protein